MQIFEIHCKTYELSYPKILFINTQTDFILLFVCLLSKMQ